jgi:hypothetical protein
LFFIFKFSANAKCWPGNKIAPTICASLKVNSIISKSPCIVNADIESFDIMQAELQSIDDEFFRKRKNLKIRLEGTCVKERMNNKKLLIKNCNDRGRKGKTAFDESIIKGVNCSK